MTVSNEAGAPTLEQQQQGGARDLKAEAAGHPLVKAVLETCPGATIEAVRPAPEPETGEDPDGG